MVSKFEGCLLGSLLGDCLGKPFEFKTRPSCDALQNFFDSLEDPTNKVPRLKYTDDTAMTNCIAESLIVQGEVDVYDIAQRFVKEYFDQPRRGYGPQVVALFPELRKSKCMDPLGPARKQFGGQGSYGNGGGMRIAPIALFFHGHETHTLASMARKTAEITHAHVYGINGAILQTGNPFRRTIQYAIYLGGDTDTIASMAGALSGAYLGYNLVYFDENVVKSCEATENTLKVARRLYSRSIGEEVVKSSNLNCLCGNS